LTGDSIYSLLNDSGGSRINRGGIVEPDARFYRRRANEELAAAQRAVTAAARERRIQLARSFLSRLGPHEADDMLFEWGVEADDKHAKASRRSTYA
jgi:hypothetical protein